MTTTATPTASIRLSEPRDQSPAQVPQMRLGGLRDVPAIARLASLTRSDPTEPVRIAQARRLLLAHVAFEHGALWVEHDVDGILTRAATAIPGGRDVISGPVLNGILRSFQPPTVGGADPTPARDEVLAAIAAAAPTWILAQLTAGGHHPWPGDTAMLATAVDWATGHTPDATLAVLAVTANERAQAERLGFGQGQQIRYRGEWWLGLRPPATA
jgi:hypothetical protein